MNKYCFFYIHTGNHLLEKKYYISITERPVSKDKKTGETYVHWLFPDGGYKQFHFFVLLFSIINRHSFNSQKKRTI